MTRAQPHPEHGRLSELPAPLRRKRRVVRIMLYWERVWRALWPGLGLAGLFVIAALFDVFSALPFWLHAVVLALFAGGLVLSLKPLLQVDIPTRMQALKRLEMQNGLRHRPLTSLSDTLTLGLDDVQTVSLWAAHKHKLLGDLTRLKTGWPRPGLARHDPYALRAVLMLLLFVAFTYAGARAPERLSAALWPVNGASAPAASLDAWITPPAYTSRPPVFLSEGLVSATPQDTRLVNVPRGSELVARLRGVSNPELLGAEQAGGLVKFERKEAGFWEARAVLEGGVQLSVRSAGQVIARWDVDVIPDRAPRIRLTAPPSVTPAGALKLEYEIADDYGVQQAEVRFTRTDQDAADRKYKYDGFLAPDFTLPLPGQLPKSGQALVFKDLTAHPWAGIDVQMNLIVRDEAGQEGRSSTASLRLPQRLFKKPLAQAIAEQRRALARDPDNRWDVGNALAAFTIAPEQFLKDTTAFLGLRAAYRHLHRIEKDIDAREILHLLWDVALRVEDDGLSLAARDLRAAQDALRRGLQQKADGAKIARLAAQLKQALAAYMQAMRQQGRRAGGSSLPGAGRIVRPQELMAMIEQIERMARSGGAKAAAEMLARLQSVLEGLQAGGGKQLGAQARAMNRWLEKLDQLMRDQQKLMDRNSMDLNIDKPNQNRSGTEQQPGMAERQDNQAQQKDLRQRLNRLRRGLGQMDLGQPRRFGPAAEAMQRAEALLARGQNKDAAADQGAALGHLRRGMRGLARKIMGRMAGQGAGRGGRADPLGRMMGAAGGVSRTGRDLPDSGQLGDAYEIRRELERRLGERGRPMMERRYLERLLQQF